MPQTVTVASKLPFPFVLAVKDKTGLMREHTIRGNAVPVGQSRPYLVGGKTKAMKAGDALQTYEDGACALTPDVDAEFFEAWRKEWADAAFVKNGFIFAHSQTASATSIARERQALRTGLEGLDPDAPAPGLKPDKPTDA